MKNDHRFLLAGVAAIALIGLGTATALARADSAGSAARSACRDITTNGEFTMAEGDFTPAIRRHLRDARRMAQRMRREGQRLHKQAGRLRMPEMMGFGGIDGDTFGMATRLGRLGGGMARAGVVTDEKIRKLNRKTNEITTTRTLADGRHITIVRKITKTAGGSTSEGTITGPKGKKRAFSESFEKQKDGWMVTTRGITRDDGKTRHVTRRVRLDGDKKSSEVEITGFDGKTRKFANTYNPKDGSRTILRTMPDGGEKAIEQTLETDDEGNVVARRMIVRRDRDRVVNLTRSVEDGKSVLVIKTPNGMKRTIIREYAEEKDGDKAAGKSGK